MRENGVVVSASPRLPAALLLLATLPLLFSCTDITTDPDLSTPIASTEITNVVVEVDYETGAEPYTGEIATGGDTWALFGSNAAVLFDDAVTFDSDTTLEEMEEVGSTGRDSHTLREILDLVELHRDEQSTDTSAAFYILFLDGYLSESGAERRDVLGVSITGTSIIAMFKPVIRGAEVGRRSALARFVEQAVLVHEFGHAVGLVNLAIPVTSDHHDAAHGAHCSNESCVMYYLNEGVENLLDFVEQWVTTNDTVLFGDECLDDVRAVRE